MQRSLFGSRYLQVDDASLRQELYLTAIGSLDSAPGQAYPPAGHPDAYQFSWSRGRILGDFVIVLISRGAGVFETRAGRRECRAGDAIVIPPGLWHRYRPNSDTGWREHWICANGALLHRLRAHGRFIAGAEVLAGSGDIRALAAHRRLWESVVGRKTPHSLALGAGALEIFASALPVGPQPAARGLSAETTGDPVADSAREFIWFNCHRPLTVGLIARQLGVSRRTLERHYLGAHGITVVHGLTALRVDRAEQLLTESRMSVKEISYAVGLGDSRRLIRHFARARGITPAAARRRLISPSQR